MAKVAILVPYQGMCEMARSLVAEWPNITPMCVEFTPAAQIRTRARELEQQGCELIVARGVHARIARRSVRIPVTEIRVTTQELGLIMMDLKRELREECPRLGLIYFPNMVQDTAHLNELFQIDLRCYTVGDSEEMIGAVDQALSEGCQAVIGGDIVCRTAEERNIPYRFMTSSEEGVRAAYETASRICYATDLAKRNSAEMDTMLNYTFSGIMQVNRSGVVQRINRAGVNLLARLPSEIVGHEVTEILPELDPQVLQGLLVEGEETYASVISVRQKAVIVNAVPIRVDDQIEGALFTFQEGKRVIEMDSRLRRELYQRGYIATSTFDQLICTSKVMAGIAELARRIAKYSSPVLLLGEQGTGKGSLAQCIHNESLQRGGAFVLLDCSAWQGETLDNMLFGNYTTRKDGSACLAEMAKEGTLYLSHVEALPVETQFKVLSLIQGKFLHNGPNQPEDISVRVMASSDVNLMARVEKGEFRRDLYYALSVLTLELPPLRQRAEDIPGWFDQYLARWQERHTRYVHLTQGAYKLLQEYDWPGNLDQMNNLCERIVLLTEKRSIDEAFLKKQLEQVTPRFQPGTERVVVYQDPKALEIAELLRRHGGDREKVAAELGVSKTTLWRYIKKYGVEVDADG